MLGSSKFGFIFLKTCESAYSNTMYTKESGCKNLPSHFDHECVRSDTESIKSFEENEHETAKNSLKKEWLKFCHISEGKQVELLKSLEHMNLEDLLHILKTVKTFCNGKIFHEMKKRSSEDIDLNKASYLINKYDKEHNDVCFASKIYSDKHVKEAKKIFVKKTLENLSIVQILTVVKNISFPSKNQNSLINHVYNEICLISDNSIIVSKPELIEAFKMLIDRNYYKDMANVCFEKLRITDRLKNDEFLNFSEMCIKNALLEHEKMKDILFNLVKASENSCFEGYLKTLEIIITKSPINLSLYRQSDLINFILCLCNTEKNPKKSALMNFISVYIDHEILCDRSHFFLFLEHHLNTLIKLGYNLEDMLDIILTSKHFIFNLVEYLLSCPSNRNDITLDCLIVDRMLFHFKYDTNVKKNYYSINGQEDIKNVKEICNLILGSFKEQFSKVIQTMRSLNLINTLEEYLLKFIREKRDLASNNDICLILETIYRYPRLDYLTYYLSENADINLAKEKLKEMDFEKILENIFKDVDFDAQNEKLEKILSSHYNMPLFILLLPKFIVFALNKHIPPQSFLKITNIILEYKKSFYEEIVIKRLELFLSRNDLCMCYRDYGIKIFSAEQKKLGMDKFTTVKN